MMGQAMIFQIDHIPPTLAALESERALVAQKIKSISLRDTIITFILIIMLSLITGLAVYWSTDNFRYAGISAAIFPLVGVTMSLLGITKAVGFRSSVRQLTDLKNEQINLNTISDSSIEDIKMLRAKYKRIEAYQTQIENEGRDLVNGELAMYWEFDASTSAKSARGRDFLDRARDSAEI